MNTRIPLIFILLFTAKILAATIDSCSSVVINPIIPEFTEKLLEQEYTQAERIIKRAPLSIEDSLYLEILLAQALMTDYESHAVDGKSFLQLCDSARIRFRAIESYKRPLHLFYYSVTLEGAVAVTRAKRKDMIGALTASNIADKYTEILIEKSPSFLPAYFPDGMRKFYASSIIAKTNWGSSKRDEAILKMEKAATDSSVVGIAVYPSLFWIYMDAELYDKAEHCAETFLKQYPQNSIMLRGLLKLYTIKDEFDVSLPLSRQIMERAQERSPINWSDYFAGSVGLVLALHGNGKTKQALEEIDSLLAIELDNNTLKLEWVKKHRKHLTQLREEFLNALSLNVE